MNIPKRVARGVALLDENQPGWAQRVDLDDFDMKIASTCVIGQVFAGYDFSDHSAYELGLEALMTQTSLNSDDFAVRHGFDLVITSRATNLDLDWWRQWETLQQEWVTAITDRQVTTEERIHA